jgi:tartrate-resistant acid phosphatase type 5
MKFLVFLILYIGTFSAVLLEIRKELVFLVNASSVSFAAVGDWGYQGQHRGEEVADAMATWCAWVDCDFYVSTGDNFYPDGVHNANDSHFRESFMEVFDPQVPMYVALGNHDYYGNVTAQLAYARVNDLWVLPSRYYVSEFPLDNGKTLRVIVLDTTPLTKYYNRIVREEYYTQNAEEQLLWLEEMLEQSSANAVNIVVAHHPCVTPVDHIQEQPGPLQELFDKYRVPLVISGHVHNLQHSWYDDKRPTHYAITGAGGLLKHVMNYDSSNCGDCRSWVEVQNGFLAVTVETRAIFLQFISATSELLREVQIDIP